MKLNQFLAGLLMALPSALNAQVVIDIDAAQRGPVKCIGNVESWATDYPSWRPDMIRFNSSNVMGTFMAHLTSPK